MDTCMECSRLCYELLTNVILLTKLQHTMKMCSFGRQTIAWVHRMGHYVSLSHNHKNDTLHKLNIQNVTTTIWEGGREQLVNVA